MSRPAAESPRLSAVPVQRITDAGRDGWLYRWNNGDFAVFWDSDLAIAQAHLLTGTANSKCISC